MKTRSSAPTTAPTKNPHTAGHSNTDRAHKQSKSLILPKGTCNDARFVLLENPRTSAKGRYYFCPERGLFEFTTIAPPTATPRSVLFVSDVEDSSSETPCQHLNASSDTEERKKDNNGSQSTRQKGFMSKSAEFLVATPIDVIFFLLLLLSPSTKSTSSRRLFQPLDDILDTREDLSTHFRAVLLDKRFRSKVESRMAAICDTVDAGETMFRLNEEKLVQELLGKAERLASSGLPPSMEEQFVRQALEKPVLSVRREDTSTTSLTEVTTTENGIESQSSVTTTATTTSSTTIIATDVDSFTSISGTSTPATELSQPLKTDAAEITQLLRIRTALQYIQSSYLPPHLSTRMNELLASPSSTRDFTPLTNHLSHLAKLRAEAAASRSLYNNTSRKRVMDDEEAEAAAEKRRKQEEEEKKRKVKEPRGIRDLKKVNTAGMKKLSSFFGKKG